MANLDFHQVFFEWMLEEEADGQMQHPFILREVVLHDIKVEGDDEMDEYRVDGEHEVEEQVGILEMDETEEIEMRLVQIDSTEMADEVVVDMDERTLDDEVVLEFLELVLQEMDEITVLQEVKRVRMELIDHFLFHEIMVADEHH